MAKKKPGSKSLTPSTDDQIVAQINGLREIKPRVRRSSAFGDDHHAAIDAQIEVLEEHLSDDAIYDRYGEGQTTQNVLDAALDARRWLNGEAQPFAEGYDDLLTAWKELAE